MGNEVEKSAEKYVPGKFEDEIEIIAGRFHSFISDAKRSVANKHRNGIL